MEEFLYYYFFVVVIVTGLAMGAGLYDFLSYRQDRGL